MNQIDKEYICKHRYCNFCKYFFSPGQFVTNTGIGRCMVKTLKDGDIGKMHGSIPNKANLFSYILTGNEAVVNSYDCGCDKYEFSIHPQFIDYTAQTPEEVHLTRKMTSFLSAMRTMKNFREACGTFGFTRFNNP